MQGKTTRVLLLAAAAVLATAVPAASYQYVTVAGKPQVWPGARATVWVDGAMFPDRAQAIAAAARTWSAVPGSAFRFVHGGTSPSTNVKDHANGNSDLYFDTTLPPFGYAVTYAFESGPNIVERDVAFNGNIAWSTSGTGPGADVETVALHELGHVLGLLHEDGGPPAVMRSGGNGNPVIPQRTLFPDDEDGVRFLYPAGGGGGGGGGPQGQDLAAGTLEVTQGSPAPGALVTLRAEVRNRSTLPAGPFRVIATITPVLPTTHRDEEVGSAEVASLAGSATTHVLLDVVVPAHIPPGRWYLGAFVDPENAVADPNRADNGAATAFFTVERPAVVAALGDSVDGGLGARGLDGAEIWIGAGTEVRVKVRGKRGVRPLVHLLPPGGGDPAASAAGGRSASLRFTAPSDGTWILEVVNDGDRVGRYRLKTSGRTKVRRAAAAAPGEVPFAAYGGGKVLLRAAWEGEAGPLSCRPPEGSPFSSPGRIRGRKATLGPFDAILTGTHAVVLGGEGPVLLDVDARTAGKGALHVR